MDTEQPVRTFEPDPEIELVKKAAEIAGDNEQLKAVLVYLTTLGLKSQRPKALPSELSVGMPYYKAAYGHEMLRVVRMAIDTQKDIQWKMADWPDIKKETVYQRLSQSLKYCFDHIADDEIKEAIGRLVFDRKVPGKLYLRWIQEKELGLANMCEAVTHQEDELSNYQETIDKFLESGTKELLHLKGLNLTPEAIERLELSLNGIEGFDYIVTASEIKLVKMRQAGTGETKV